MPTTRTDHAKELGGYFDWTQAPNLGLGRMGVHWTRPGILSTPAGQQYYFADLAGHPRVKLGSAPAHPYDGALHGQPVSSAQPAAGTWQAGDFVWRQAGSATDGPGWRCIASGTHDTIAATGTATTGSPDVTSIASPGGLALGALVTSNAFSGTRRVIGILSANVTLSGANAGSSGSGSFANMEAIPVPAIAGVAIATSGSNVVAVTSGADHLRVGMTLNFLSGPITGLRQITGIAITGIRLDANATATGAGRTFAHSPPTWQGILTGNAAFGLEPGELLAAKEDDSGPEGWRWWTAPTLDLADLPRNGRWGGVKLPFPAVLVDVVLEAGGGTCGVQVKRRSGGSTSNATGFSSAVTATTTETPTLVGDACAKGDLVYPVLSNIANLTADGDGTKRVLVTLNFRRTGKGE